MVANHKEIAAQSPVSRWYAVYSVPRHEKRLAEHFHVRDIEHFLPLYYSVRRWKDGSKVNLELPLFPSYIFVRIARHQRARVLEVPGVVSIVGGGNESAALLDCEIEALRRGLVSLKIEPFPYLVVGQKVRIINGPFLGFEGVLLRKKKVSRVILTLSVISESVALEIDACDLSPACLVEQILGLSSTAAA